MLVLSKIRAAIRAAHPSFARDERGSVTILSVVTMVVTLAFAALSIDGSNYYYQKRRQQAATDVAALAAATDLTQASALAINSGTANGFQTDAITSVELGTYSTDPSVPAARRFVRTTVSPTAVRVTMQTRPAFIFGRVLSALVSPALASDPNAVTGLLVKTMAVASNQNVASFSLGTGLAQLNGGIENGLLSALLGSQVSLSIMDYQSLAGANVDLFSFGSALATRARITGPTYSSVASATVTSAQALAAVADVLRGSGSAAAAAALAQIVSAAGPTSQTLPVTDLISYGPFGTVSLAATHPMNASVSALSLVSAALQVANGQSPVQFSLAAPVPGVASVAVQIVIGQPVLTTSLVTVGAVGASLHAAQTRILLTFQLVGSGAASLVTLPLYVEVGSGTAQLTSIQCTSTTAQATLGVTPGVVDAWIGAVTTSDMTNLAAAPSPGPATLLNLLDIAKVFTIAKVTGRANGSIGNTAATAVPFSPSEIAANTQKTTSTTDYAASLYASLMGNLQVSVTIFGLPILVPFGLAQTVTQVVANAAVPVDQILSQTLSALGVSVGNATTAVSGVKCGRSTLVN